MKYVHIVLSLWPLLVVAALLTYATLIMYARTTGCMELTELTWWQCFGLTTMGSR